VPFQPPRGFKRALLEGDPKFGLFCGASSAQLTELAALAGFDYVILDVEHGDGADIASMLPLIRAADAARTPAIVRVPRNSSDTIQRVLDYGALGVCVPHVRTAEDAVRAVRYAKYAPAGERSMSPLVRAAQYRGGSDWNEYWQVANAETIVIVIVEDGDGLANVEEIAAVPGVDVLWIGAGDLAQSLQIPGELNHPLIVEARLHAVSVANRNGIASFCSLGPSAVVDPATRRDQVRQLYRQGYRMFCWADTAVYEAVLRDLLRVALSGVDKE
jgi:4-hydroxy-2-oxoheptanedioate aldolase